MTTLDNRPNTALLVVDVQNGVVRGTHERDMVVANIGSLVEKARQAQVPAVWVPHSDEHLARGGDDWRIVPDLSARRRTEDQTEWRAPPPGQVIAHTNLYWTYQTAPGRTAGTVVTKDVDFGGVS
ncbi:MAG TPA: isochorismatase family protein [Micromonosporaceae bacterium]|nr:isochorismatase family protein [Micromonosporaceae bacterium]